MAGYYTGAGDGYCDNYTGANWDAIHDALTCTDGYAGGQSVQIYVRPEEIVRTFYPINTNGITGTILGATLHVYLQYSWGLSAGGDNWINVVQTTQASTSDIVEDDYDQCGAVDNPTEGSTRKDTYAVTTSIQLVHFVLNSTGISWINTSGYTKLGLREGHDAIDSNPGSYIGSIYSYFSESLYDPYFDVITGNYTKEDVASLPADDTNLSGAFTAQNYLDVADDNDVYVSQTSVGKYAMFLFKNIGGMTRQAFTLTWKGKSDRAPSTSIVKLQIYNRIGTVWEDVDTENSVGAGTEFTLSGTITSNLDNYYDASNIISCRVYQQAI